MTMNLHKVTENVNHTALSHSQLAAIEQQEGASAFYFLDLEKLKQNYHALNAAFKAEYPHCQVAYSFKTNYAPKLCQTLRQLGCWAEVVSAMEYDIARNRVGYPASQIIVNGPLHEPEFVERALLDGALFNIDAWYLLEHVKDLCARYPERHFRIGVRLRYAVDEGGFSRFGILSSESNLQRLAQWQQSVSNCDIVGFHSHFSNSSRSLVCFRSRILGLLNATQRFFGDQCPHFINIGGGFFGEMPSELADQFSQPDRPTLPSFNDYARCVAHPLNQSYAIADNVSLLLEPGTALVANAMVFVCKVYEVNNIDGKTVALVNGSNHNINHKWQGEALPLQLVKSQASTAKACADQTSTFDIAANTCIEKDILRVDVNGAINAGDYIIFQYMGAYTNVLKQPFIHPCQAIYAYENDELITVKRQETAKDILASYE